MACKTKKKKKENKYKNSNEFIFLMDAGWLDACGGPRRVPSIKQIYESCGVFFWCNSRRMGCLYIFNYTSALLDNNALHCFTYQHGLGRHRLSIAYTVG